MQQDLPVRRRRWPLIVVALILAVTGVWSAAWYYAADRAETTIAEWREREAKAGRIHTCGSQIVSGFPLRFEMRCSDPGLELKSAQPPLLIKAKDVLITARVWQPTLLTSEITGPLTIAEPGQPHSVAASWRYARTQVRGLPTSPEQVTILLDEPVFDRIEGADRRRLFNASRLELNGRMLEGSARNNPVIEVVLKLAGASAPTLHPTTVNPLDADVTAVLRGLKNFAPKPWSERFREIQAAGGRIDIANARVKQGDTVALAEGTLGLSPGGRPDGELRLSVANLANLLPALALGGREDRSQRVGAALVAGLNFIGKPAEIEGQRAVVLPLRFRDGAVTLGPIPLGQTAPLF